MINKFSAFFLSENHNEDENKRFHVMYFLRVSMKQGILNILLLFLVFVIPLTASFVFV